MADDFHRQGLRIQLWWLPLGVEDGQGKWESHKYIISKVVKEHAMGMAQAVIGEGEKGQLAPTKYLLELAGVFPASDGSAPTEQEESLAETLFRKLNVPTTPVKLSDEDEDEVVVIPAASEKILTTGDTEGHGENPKPFKPEQTEEQRAEAGEPSGV